MRILFTMLAYNDLRKGVGFYSNFASEIRQRGHDVTVVAPSLNGETELNDEGGVQVLRVKTGKLFNVHPVIKGINNMRLPSVFRKALSLHLQEKQFDWIVSPTPPVTFAPLIKQLKQRYDCPSYLILRDIFPQNARDLGLIKNKFVFNYFRRKERQLYSISDVIGCMSQGNIDYVRHHNPELNSSKLSILSNWIARPHSPRSQDSNAVKAKWGLEGKFVAIFGGNFGKPQKIESILDLAGEVKSSNPDIVFLLVGDGTERMRIADLVKSRNLTNVVIKGKIPQEDYLQLASACDIGLVNLSDKFTIPNIPSRTLAYWAAGLPILACVDSSTDLGGIISDANAGFTSVTGDLQSYKANLLKLHEDPTLRRQMGSNGLAAVQEKFDTKLVVQEFIHQLESFTSTANAGTDPSTVVTK